jgi:type I restriction enzyme, S subunit
VIVAHSNWQAIPIRELYEGLYDGPHATPRPSKDGPVFLGIKNVTDDGQLDLSDIRHISEADFPRWTRRVEPRPGDIVFTYEATLNRYAIIPEGFRGCLGRRMALIRPDARKVDTRFLLYYFFTAEWRSVIVKKMMSGATVDRIPLITFPTFPVRIPPLAIQRNIAGIIACYDQLIENNQRRIRILEEMARALYREWFVQFRFPGHEGIQRVASPLGGIPEGWEVKKLGEIAQEMRENLRKGTLNESKPYVGLEHIPRRSLALDAWEMTDELGSNKLEFKKGDVLFGKIRPYFHKVSIAPFNGVCSADTIVIRARQTEYYAFVAACVSSDEFVAHASATSNGAKMPRANWDVLKNYHVAIPSGQAAEQFSTLFTSIIAQQQTLIFQIENLRRTRDLLLPRLMSGQIELKAG